MSRLDKVEGSLEKAINLLSKEGDKRSSNGNQEGAADMYFLLEELEELKEKLNQTQVSQERRKSLTKDEAKREENDALDLPKPYEHGLL